MSKHKYTNMMVLLPSIGQMRATVPAIGLFPHQLFQRKLLLPFVQGFHRVPE